MHIEIKKSPVETVWRDTFAVRPLRQSRLTHLASLTLATPEITDTMTVCIQPRALQETGGDHIWGRPAPCSPQGAGAGARQNWWEG